MIVISIALVLVAAGLLGVGLLQGSDTLYYASIVMSVLAALSLTVGVRQAPAARASDDDFDVRPGPPPAPDEIDDDVSDPRAYVPRQSRRSARAEERSSRRSGRPEQTGSRRSDDPAAVGAPPKTDAAYTAADRAAEAEEVDPPDEPPIQEASVADIARVATMVVEVFVIDGRPRYHLAQCLHLLGRDYEGLPVSEAVELGFTPCAQCQPIRVLLATAPRGLI